MKARKYTTLTVQSEQDVRKAAAEGKPFRFKIGKKGRKCLAFLETISIEPSVGGTIELKYKIVEIEQ